jgi:hypothetical protein
VAQITANLKTTKQQLEQLQAKFQKVEEENKKLEQMHSKSQKADDDNKKYDQLHSKFLKAEEENRKLTEQLRQAVAKINEKPPPTKIEPPKPEPIKSEPIKTEPKPATAKPEPAKQPAKFGQLSYLPPSDATPHRNFKIPPKSSSPTPGTTATQNTSSSTTASSRPRSATTSNTTPTYTSTPSPVKEVETPVTKEKPYYSNPQRNSGFGNLKGTSDPDNTPRSGISSFFILLKYILTLNMQNRPNLTLINAS